MIVIQTYKVKKETQQPTYKNYYATTKGSLKLVMEGINIDRENNDLTVYEPIVIYNIFDTEEE